jgi:hypothetical protein
MLAVLISFLISAHASGSGNRILETIGVSVAVGTVLGASTLPFCDQPGKNLMSVASGASVGILAGVRILVYGLFEGFSQNELDLAAVSRRIPVTTRFHTPAPSIWTSLVSLTW